MSDFIPVSKIRPNPRNRPRGSGTDITGLVKTVERLGILEPVIVRQAAGGFYELLAGERRWRAAIAAGCEKIPAMVRHPGNAPLDLTTVLIMVVENCQREPIGPVEMALAMGELRRHMTVQEIAEYTGLTSQTISYHLQLTKAAPETLDAVRTGRLSAGAVHDAITGTLPDRRQARSRGGSRQQARPRPPRASAYFNASHRLAPAAHVLCGQQNHPAADKIGKVACGECWEGAIRADQDNHARQCAPRARALTAAS